MQENTGVNVRVKGSIYLRLKAKAEARGSSLTSMVTNLLYEWLEEDDAREAAKPKKRGRKPNAVGDVATVGFSIADEVK